jgi:hypothetical protein
LLCGVVSEGLVVAAGVEGQYADEVAGGGVDDADVAVLDEQEDLGSSVGSSDADVVQAAVEAQGDDSGGVDPIAADPEVRAHQDGASRRAPRRPLRAYLSCWHASCRKRRTSIFVVREGAGHDEREGRRAR